MKEKPHFQLKNCNFVFFGPSKFASNMLSYNFRQPLRYFISFYHVMPIFVFLLTKVPTIFTKMKELNKKNACHLKKEVIFSLKANSVLFITKHLSQIAYLTSKYFTSVNFTQRSSLISIYFLPSSWNYFLSLMAFIFWLKKIINK